MDITAITEEDFRKQFQLVLQQFECTSIQNIVYFWKAGNLIPRVVGESNILYIGQTTNSLNGRYGGTKAFEIEVAYFMRFYKTIIQKYGSIFIEVKATENPKYSEWEELANYFSIHLEYPPLNRFIPSDPSKKAKQLA